jgi:hypothetical protein
MGWAEHVGRMTGMRNAFKMMVGKPEGRDLLEDLGLK